MDEIKIKAVKKELRGLKTYKLQKEALGPDKERKRTLELIYLQRMVYLAIKEAVFDPVTEEIQYNLILIRFDPKTKELKELMNKQLNLSPVKTTGFTCERIQFNRCHAGVYFFVFGRCQETRLNQITLHMYDLEAL
jgi:hypothetical protein